MGYKVIGGSRRSGGIAVGERTLENASYKLVFDESGALVSLWDKRFGREIAAPGEKLNEFRAYEDMPYQYDNWEIAPYYKQKEWILKRQGNV